MTKQSLIFILTLMVLTGCSNVEDKLYLKSPANYSYIIGNVKGSSIDQQYHADSYIVPASCQKVIIALLANQALGLEYQYDTNLYTSKVRNKLQDIILNFNGDPTLTSENLVHLLEPLRDTAINNIILDSSYYKTTSYSPNLVIHEIGTNSGRPVSAINIDENYVLIKVSPSQSGQKATIENNMGYTIDSNILTSTDDTSINFLWEDNVIRAKGNININDSREIKISPPNLDSYIFKKIDKILTQLNIKGKISIVKDTSKIPTNKELIDTHKSKQLSEIIPPALKISDNLIFDSLYLTLIIKKSLLPIYDWAEGAPIIKQLVKEHLNVNLNDTLIVDGSGMSRFNRIQTRSLFEILKAGYSVKGFVESLNSPEEDKSTLKKRINLPSTLRSKTGSLFGIRCLCGYNLSKIENKVFVFSVNNYAAPVKEIYAIEEGFINEAFAKGLSSN